jgi:lipopolysaccharide export system protein LptA
MMTKLRHLAPIAILPLALALSSMGSAGAAEKKASSPFQGFSSDNGKPIDVKSDSLEVHQDEQKAIFTGNVVATQGDSVLRTNELTVFYDNSAPAAGGPGDAKPADAKPADAKPAAAKSAEAKPADASADAKPADASADAKPAENGKAAPAVSPGQANSIKKLLAKGNVIVTSKDQKATGDDGVFDMATNLATLTGKEVVMIQNGNVVRGKKLVVNLKTGISNVYGGTTGLFQQSGQKPNQQNSN